MKKIALLAGLIAAPISAYAADMPNKKMAPVAPAVPEIVSWTGAYVGLQAGMVSSQTGLNIGIPDVVDLSYPTNTVTQGLIGGRFGYDWQFDRMVVGIVADADLRIGSASWLPNNTIAQAPYGWKTTSNWDAGVRARAGYLVTDNFLAYATGGLALANYKLSNPSYPGEAVWEFDNIWGGTRVGWAVGAGAEYKITKNWSLNVEYLYSDYGTHTPDLGGGYSTKSKIDSNTVKVGVNYRF